MKSDISLICCVQSLLLAVCAGPRPISEAQDQPAPATSGSRNNVAAEKNIPDTWNIGRFTAQTAEWNRKNSRNVKWAVRLGSLSYSSPVVADGRVFVGTNNGAGYLPRYPKAVDLGCLLCFSAADGQFQWQYSAEKLKAGRVHDWPMYGIRSSPLVQGDRVWLVDNRCQVVCLDTQGFADGVDDGPEKAPRDIASDMREADVVWKLDMISELGVSPHNWSTCSPASYGDLLFITTSNGVDLSHVRVPAPNAPSLIALDKRTGCVVWSDNSPGENILHGQWSSPTVGVLGCVPQVVFGGGDGWVYSFRADRWDIQKRRPTLLWKFDANPKKSKWILSGRGTRNIIVASPVIHGRHVYVAVGQDPEHGEGDGHLWCIDPTRRGDISPELAFRVEGDRLVPLPPRRLQAVDSDAGEVASPNPNSGVVWHYDRFDSNADGRFDFEEIMHRTICRPAIQDGLLFIPDYSGLVHCLDADTGRPHWTCDLFACAYGAPLIADGKVFIGDQDGDVAVLRLSADASQSTTLENKLRTPRIEIPMNRCIYGDIAVSDGVLFVVANTHLFAISNRTAVTSQR